MGKQGEVYKCNICNQVVEVITEGAGQLVCCGEAMELQQEKVTDEGQEKHAPVVDQTQGKVTVRVGSEPHPMEEKHYISMIEVRSGGETVRKFLAPGEKPEAVFDVSQADSAREFCTVHGLWKSGK